MSEQKIDKDSWYEAAIEAVRVGDAGESWDSLRSWEDVFGADYTKKVSNEDTENLRMRLLFCAFPFISEEMAMWVMQFSLVNFVLSDNVVSEKIEERIKVAGYGRYDSTRLFMRKALFQNQELLGDKSIAEWTSLFEKYLLRGESDGKASGRFFVSTPQISELGKDEQGILRIILQIFEDWLYEPIVSIFDIAETLNTGPRDSNKQQRIELSGTSKLPLLEALSKFPNLGQQAITGERIKLKHQTEPVRGSLLNWIKYYREELGVGYHESVVRGQFLFQSQNGKKLSASDRERVSLIIRSIEDNEPVEIDTARQEILFPEFVESAPRRSPAPTMSAPRVEEEIVEPPQWVLPSKPPVVAKAPSAPTPAFRADARAAEIPDASRPQTAKPLRFDPYVISPTKGGGGGEDSVRSVDPKSFSSGGMHIGGDDEPEQEPGTLSFTTKHVLPAEKEVLSNTKPAVSAPSTKNVAPQGPPPAPMRKDPAVIPNPFRIDPSSRG